MKAQVIVLPKDCQIALPNHVVGSPGGISINVAVSMIEIEQEDWVEEVLDDGMVGMLNVQFDNMIAEDESDFSCL